MWRRFNDYLYADESLGLSLDISRMAFPDGYFEEMARPMAAAFTAMRALEAGSLANPDEGWQVGHYWLRTPELAPAPEQAQQVLHTRERIRRFARAVRCGRKGPKAGSRFRNALFIGIGGSALGPQLLADALEPAAPESADDRPLRPFFLDNTDPDGMVRVLEQIGDGLEETLTVVTSKSGGTQETRNGMLALQAAYGDAGLDFAKHAVAITREGSRLDRAAAGWLKRFPMWDWVGGRTSVFSAVGLLPAALLGIDIDAFIRGGRQMDAATRRADVRTNPAALLALMWHHAGGGRGEKDMVVLPYRDRLQLFPRYLQQLVMESLGKEYDLSGRRVNQGVVVYGNKGSTDQHAYIQQLREGANNFFAVFIDVLRDAAAPDGEDVFSPASVEVSPGITSGDYLSGFLQGTRRALAENGRESLTITLETLDAAALGRLIALFDRAVGLYAALAGINAYHQPGVEAGKQAAERVIELQQKAVRLLRGAARPFTAEEVAACVGAPGEAETVYHVLRRLAANGRGIRRFPGDRPDADRFSA